MGTIVKVIQIVMWSHSVNLPVNTVHQAHLYPPLALIPYGCAMVWIENIMPSPWSQIIARLSAMQMASLLSVIDDNSGTSADWRSTMTGFFFLMETLPCPLGDGAMPAGRS